MENTGEISDGYHTFNELYEHRHLLFIALMGMNPDNAWYSLEHKDDAKTPMPEGWFIAGINLPKRGMDRFTGEGAAQISYHLPIRFLQLVRGLYPTAVQPKYDGHTSEDTLIRLRAWLGGEW